MFPDMPLPVSSNCATAPQLPEEAVGDFLLLRLYWSSCLITHVLLNLQVHTWGMSHASFAKFVYNLVSSTDQLWREIDLLWMQSTHQLSLICLPNGLAVSALKGPSSSDMDAPIENSWWSYRARWRCRYFTSIYDGSCWLPLCGLLLSQCSPAEFLWISLDGVGWCFFVGPFILPL